MLKNIKKLFFTIILAMFFAMPAMACTNNEIDVLADGTQCETSKFEITTTNLSANTEFIFYMSAAGVFYVDWGDGNIQTIDRTGNTTETQYTHTYTTAGAKTIRFGGAATSYSTTTIATIRFGNSPEAQNSVATPTLVRSISGSLGALFPSKSAYNDGQPCFYYSFSNCSALTSIPENLFLGVSGTKYKMFEATFIGTGITSIPENLFQNITGYYDLFVNTFRSCTSLQSIPSGLFRNITKGYGWMFQNTFYGCTSLTSIPENLFSSVSGQGMSIFNGTFTKCTGLTSIPSSLFSGVTGPATSMFQDTFVGCTSLTSIPENLFSKVSGAATSMFQSTFSGCTGLTSIPQNLFSGVTTGADYMFSGTFNGCTGLTALPGGLFHNLTTGAPNMFTSTFAGCSGLTSLPDNFFASITSSSAQMFDATFQNCTGITSIPGTLFKKISIGAPSMFSSTFNGCTRLASLPEDLFGSITTDAAHMFRYTFKRTALAGYIPPSTFAGLIANSSPTADGMWYGTFENTSLVSSCPTGTTEYNTGYQTAWGGKVSCQVNANQTCVAGEYLPKLYNSCTACPINSYCGGGTYAFSSSVAQGVTPCPNNLFAPTGMSLVGQCGRKMHVGDDIVYLRSEKLTTPSLNVQIGNDRFYANMTTTRTKMNKDSNRYFHAQWGNNDYYICDDTTCPGN